MSSGRAAPVRADPSSWLAPRRDRIRQAAIPTEAPRRRGESALRQRTPRIFEPSWVIKRRVARLTQRPAAADHQFESASGRELGRCKASTWRLRRVRELRDAGIQANPRRCARCPDIQHRLELGRLVQSGEAYGSECRIGFAPSEQRRAAGRTEAAGRVHAATRPNSMGSRLTHDNQIRTWDDDSGSKWGAARALTIFAVTVQHRDRCA